MDEISFYICFYMYEILDRKESDRAVIYGTWYYRELGGLVGRGSLSLNTF